MQKDVILTPEGLEKLKQEIEHLSTTKRREVAERIKEAREFGDISENSEYDDAKNEQAMLESRIATLEGNLQPALQRVTGGQGAGGPQEGRRRQGDASFRQAARADRHRHPSRLSGGERV